MTTQETKSQRTFFLLLAVLAAIVAVFGVRVIREGWRVREADRPQKPPSVLASDPVRGAENASVTIIEYADFQCPLCRLEQTAITKALAKYQGKIRLVWKDFPVAALHDQSVPAATAARCAQAQGKFWEMHDRLFLNQDRFSPTLFLSLAGQLGLDTDQFAACQSSTSAATLVQDSLQAGQQIGIDGTPSYFLNTARLTQFPSEQELDAYLNQF